jgi:hypothetical protein
MIYELKNKKVNSFIFTEEDESLLELHHDNLFYPFDSLYKKMSLEPEVQELGEGILMEVSDYEDFKESYEENVLLMYRNKFIAVDEEGLIYSWKYARPIQEKVTLTKQEIADKFDIDINQLIIK